MKPLPDKKLINPRTRKLDKRLQKKQTKLSDEQVVLIRKEYARGNTSLRKLAAKYDVSHVLISYLVRRKKRIKT